MTGKRKMKWAQGRPVNGATYYIEAEWEGEKFTMSKCFVDGLPKYSLYRGKSFVQIGDGDEGKKNLLNLAETL